jgi:hypothetical protein
MLRLIGGAWEPTLSGRKLAPTEVFGFCGF